MKKFTTIFMTLIIMLMVTLTGCSTFRIDKVKYYNEVLAKVGNENITRFELINAYNSYGYTNYVTQGGQTEKQALVSTMDTLIQRKLIVKQAKENPDKYGLNAYEIKKLYRDTIDYLLESFESNKQTARDIYNLEAIESSTTDETVEAIKLSDYSYQSRVKVENGNIVFDDEYTNLEQDEDLIKETIDEKYITDFATYCKNDPDAIVEALLDKFKHEFYFNENNEEVVTYVKVCDKAIELACNNLINYEYYLREDGKKLSTKQEDLLFRFVERTFEAQLESAYITKVNNVYLQNETLSNESVLNAFKALYKSDYAKYANDAEAYNTKITATDSDLIYYTPDGDAEFGYFLHVLLPLNNVEDDLKWLKEHRHLYTDEEYKAEQMSYINQIMCAQRTTEEVRDSQTGELLNEEGVVLDEEVALADVLSEYSANVNDLSSFINFMFKYTTDTATLTADMPYIIGYNTKTDAEYSAMVANFTKEAIRLMKNNQTYTKSNEYILTNYGIHLLYYVAPVTNQIAYEDLNSLTVQQLDGTILNQATGETYLDRVFDLVYPAGTDGMFTSNTKYSQFEQNFVDSLYSVYPVTKYDTKIKASNKI